VPLDDWGRSIRVNVTINRSEDLSSLVHGLDILRIVDNYDPNVHCEH